MNKMKEIPSIDLGDDGAPSFQIRSLVSFNYDPDESPNPELPHRHNFQELIWIKSGSGKQTIDGEMSEISAATFYLIAKGQVHHFLKAKNVDGFVLRFNEEFRPRQEVSPTSHFFESFFNNVRTIQALSIDSERTMEFDALLSLMVKEFEAPRQFGKYAILWNLLQALLIKIAQNLENEKVSEDQSGPERDNIFMDFLALLEEHYKGHHDVAFYAETLAITPRQLSDRTSRMIGKTAKQVIEERLALEAKRAFKFTKMPVKEVAYDLGYEDPSYFSKVFKRVTGHTPQEFQAL